MTGSTLPQKTVLFTDFRHIQCGDLGWLSPEGKGISLRNPPEPQIEVEAGVGLVPRGIRLQAQRADKTNTLELPEGVAMYPRVICDGGVYRAWHLHKDYGSTQNPESYLKQAPSSVEVCYVESTDAYRWTEKARCPIDVPGQTWLDGFTVFIDPASLSEERYKAVYSARPPKSQWPALWEAYQEVHPRYRDTRLDARIRECLYGAVSPDGLHWAPIPEPLMVHKGDTDNTMYYDPWLQRYVLYTRLYWQDRRWIARAEAEDFRNWGPVQPLIWPKLDGSPSDDMYTNGRSEYPGIPSEHLMFPMVYHRLTQTSDIRRRASRERGTASSSSQGRTWCRWGTIGLRFRIRGTLSRTSIPAGPGSSKEGAVPGRGGRKDDSARLWPTKKASSPPSRRSRLVAS
jgi:hypothetical protein